MKDANELTNDDLAEGAGVSLKTIERLMSGHCDQDIMRETARRIEDVILGSSNRFPCILAFEEENKPTASRLEVALADLERVAAENAELRRQVEFLREENQLKAKIIDHFLDK
jgi:plasmid maintenance system antidote protein VapI